MNASRRTFLKVGAITGIGALGAGLLGACADGQADGGSASGAAQGGSPQDIHWDGIFDVVVIGFGAAGAASAISAAKNGANVLLIDKAPEGAEGGNSRFSAQMFISAEDRAGAVEYFQALRGDFYTPDDVLDAYADGLCTIKGTLAEWGLDTGKIIDITDVDIDALLAEWQ